MTRPKHYDRPCKRPGPARERGGGAVVGGSVVDQRAAVDQRQQLAALTIRYCFYCDAERIGPRCRTCGGPTR